VKYCGPEENLPSTAFNVILCYYNLAIVRVFRLPPVCFSVYGDNHWRLADCLFKQNRKRL
jgi:hypothetical protein